jgi:hypothetical protein
MFGQSDAQAYHRYGHHSHSYNHYKHKSQHHRNSCWRTNRSTGNKFRIC